MSASPSAKRQKLLENDDNPASNVRVTNIRPLLPPACLEEMLPIPPEAALTVQIGRAGTVKVLERTDDRLIVICGPCSIHDTKAGLEYATKLRAECLKHAADLLIIMRVYFEKPRTTVGWKGLINDPNMDGTFNINQGLQTARQFLIDVNKLGIPCATEFLDTVSPQYCADLISWGAIGARTTESQLHRELASGLSVPIGFKNGTSGALQIAVDAVKSANNPHAFMGVTRQGLAAIIETAGNPHGHVILRGGSETGPQFSAEWVSKTAAAMSKAGVHPNVVVDCSHANSQKKHENQPKVAADVASQLKGGSKDLVGLMLESHLHEGNQAIKGSPADLKYGVSVTDACIDFETTEKVLDELAEAVRIRREN